MTLTTWIGLGVCGIFCHREAWWSYVCMCLCVAYGWRCRRRKDRRNRHSRHLKRKEKLWTDFFFAECCYLSIAIAPFCLVFSCPTTAVLCFAFFDGKGQRIVSRKGGSVGLTPSCSHAKSSHICRAFGLLALFTFKFQIENISGCCRIHSRSPTSQELYDSRSNLAVSNCVYLNIAEWYLSQRWSTRCRTRMKQHSAPTPPKCSNTLLTATYWYHITYIRSKSWKRST